MLSSTLVFRADVDSAAPLSVPAPTLPTGDLPIATAVNVKAGGTLSAGEVIGAVAGRPVIAMSGAIPMYRSLQQGDTGGDVAELQAGLRALGYPTASDPSGTYGAGTAAAVSRLYGNKGFQPILAQPLTSSTGACPASDTTGAGATGSTATPASTTSAMVGAGQGRGLLLMATSTSSTTTTVAPTTTTTAAPATTTTTAPTTITSPPSATTPAPAASSTGGSTSGTTGTSSCTPVQPTASVPLGEIAFVPTLPAQVLSVSLTPGQQVATSTGGSSASSTGMPSAQSSSSGIVQVGSGGLSISGQVDQTDGASLRAGMPVTLNDDVSGGQWPGTITAVQPPTSGSTQSGSIPQDTVVITPTASSNMPVSEIGANVRVTATKSSTKTAVLVVPVAALYARSDGKEYVTVVSAHGPDRTVPVTVGVDTNGDVQVTPEGGALAAGDDVLVGSGGSLP